MANERATRLPREGTISRALIDYWRDPESTGGKGGKIRFSAAVETYCCNSPTYNQTLNGPLTRTFQWRADFAERARMNVLRLLKAYGHKDGERGSRAPWVFDFNPKRDTLGAPAPTARHINDPGLRKLASGVLPVIDDASLAKLRDVVEGKVPNGPSPRESRLECVIRDHAMQLLKWALEARRYGWSTFQEEPMKKAAADLLSELV